jgi:hypothetical protein
MTYFEQRAMYSQSQLEREVPFWAEIPQRKVSRRSILIGGAGLVLPFAALVGYNAYAAWHERQQPYKHLFSIYRDIPEQEGYIQQAVWSPDGTRIVLEDTIYDAETGQKMLTFQPQGNQYSWSSDGKRLLARSVGGGWFRPPTAHISLIDTSTGKLMASFQDNYLVASNSVKWESQRTLVCYPHGKGFMVVGRLIDVWGEQG